MRLVINAINLFGAGTRTLAGSSLIPNILRTMEGSKILLLVPDLPVYKSIALPPGVEAEFFRRHRGFYNDVGRMRELTIGIPKFARRFRADVCLTLGDLMPMRMACPSITFVQQALFLYEDDEIAGRNSWPWAKRRFLLWLFKTTILGSNMIIVQSPVMARRMAKKYAIDPERIVVISSPAPIATGGLAAESVPFRPILQCEKVVKLLFLAVPYRHKNHAILPSVARELRRRKLSNLVQIFVTLDDSIVNSAKMRRELSSYSDTITNLGYLRARDVAQALMSSSALFIPTLVESYGNIYLEAMSRRLPILTSDRDFARWMCGDLARYFNPLDPVSIVDAIEETFVPPKEPNEYSQKITKRLGELPADWNEVALKFADLIYLLAGKTADY